MAKIQDTFKELLKNTIAPKLRAFGLKGSGQNYSIKSDSHWALIGIQKSMYSDSKGLKFTINLYVVSKEQWETAQEKRSYFPEKPTANVHWGIGWNKRIGHLLPEELDHWWSFDAGTDLDNLANEVVDAICSKAVPAMQEQMKNAYQTHPADCQKCRAFCKKTQKPRHFRQPLMRALCVKYDYGTRQNNHNPFSIDSNSYRSPCVLG